MSVLKMLGAAGWPSFGPTAARPLDRALGQVWFRASPAGETLVGISNAIFMLRAGRRTV